MSFKNIFLVLLIVSSCQGQQQNKTNNSITITANNEVIFKKKNPDVDSVSAFTKKKTELIPVGDSANAFFDVDKDGDQDLIISGYTNSPENLKTVTRLYINDGTGNYTHDKRSVFSGVEYGGIDVADIDNDNDFDIILTGQQLENKRLNIEETNAVKLYINNNGVFKEDSHFELNKIYWGTVKFCNFNRDTHKDLLVIANNFSEIFTNQNSELILEKNINLEKLYDPIVAVFDMDKDLDDDIVIQGTVDEINPRTIVYENRSGQFISKKHNFFPATQGILKAEDIDNDGDKDLFISGAYMPDENTTKMKSLFYINDGKGNFKETDTEVIGYNMGNLVFADIDNDNDKDLIITGNRIFDEDYDSNEGTDIYLNDGKGYFTLYKKAALDFYSQHSINVADIDGDGDQDVLLTGYYKEDIPTTTIYINNHITP
ncbi:FG-GAP repeat domain-containing protein [Aquimarina algiphila]|uniref:FG-GAP repeat domain-containing protein n=1 Tax=Aquimarina algiphila TaxID=2047982 RepID=UPI002492EDD4|nr:VCBS repeat-containing protein [Aquimarina algiphila]